MAAVETCRLPVDGGDTVFCEVTGHGPALVLTHDAIVHREGWDAQFEALSRSYRVVRWDRRGYGRSDRPRHLRHEGGAEAALMDHIGMETR